MILIDGHLKKNDNVIVAKRDSVIITKPKALLLPKALDEMRDPRDKFKPIDEVQAAAGIKIASPDLEGVLPGTTVYASSNQESAEEFKSTLESEMESVFIDTETTGVMSAFAIGTCCLLSISVIASNEPIVSHFRITPVVSVSIKTDSISDSSVFLNSSVVS